jgi:hypothetical protein
MLLAQHTVRLYKPGADNMQGIIFMAAFLLPLQLPRPDDQRIHSEIHLLYFFFVDHIAAASCSDNTGLPVVERTLKEITQTQGFAFQSSCPLIFFQSVSKLSLAS